MSVVERTDASDESVAAPRDATVDVTELSYVQVCVCVCVRERERACSVCPM